ncbi:RNA polymerase sigma factor [Dasania marina]|uniref:RNA polymerase sigma factor n=1 Tax=Dasania marina TaxID=471499 RepID=UPI00037076A9|nr:sigma-70 family RNA polymerase sigma factor [Dasania marina]
MPKTHIRLVSDRSDTQPATIANTRSDAMRAGQRQYVERLFQSYKDSLHRHIYRLLRNKDDAQELMQETYIRVLQRENLEQQESSAKAYLFKIATNLVIDKTRKDARQQLQQHVSIDDEELVSNNPSPDRQVQSQQVMTQLKIILNQLSPRGRHIFILHRFHDMSYPEIADKLNITTRTVERQMSIAMTLCREKLQGLL